MYFRTMKLYLHVLSLPIIIICQNEMTDTYFIGTIVELFYLVLSCKIELA